MLQIRKAITNSTLKGFIRNKPYIVNRPFFNLSSIIDRYKANSKLLEVQSLVETNPNNEKIVAEYIRSLVEVSPSEAVSYIERGWSSGKLPMNEGYLKEYFKAVASLKKIDSLNISGILALLQKHNQTGASDLTNVIRAVNGAGAGSGGFQAGSSPREPLYIAATEGNWKSQAWKLLRVSIVWFIGFSLLGTFIDEKGPAGGIGARLGISSVVHQAESSDKTFDDVVGVDEAKGDLQEIVMYLKDPKKFTRLGGKLPKGVLLTGPPGTGKTLLARAIAGEAKVPFFHASGSEFEEMYVGVGAKRVRELFEVAKQKSPCIIFIDEIDAIGGSRQIKDQSAMKMTLNQLLVEMDGFQQNNGVIVIGATNFPDSLDSALVRPGRFDKHVEVSMPDIGGRKAILQFYAGKIPMDADVDIEQLARGTPGFSGAELFNLVNQAALKASVDGLKSVGMSALEFAKDKIMMGAERRSAIISPETMKMTAFHEAGHALVALKTDGSDPIHKATIMPRGRALGMVMQLPDGDQTSMSRKQMLARLDVCMGGRVAEELIFGAENVTSGASGDIQQATRLARNMVMKFGLSDKVGMLFVDEKAALSSATQQDIDLEVKTLLSSSYSRAKTILEGHRKDLEVIAQGLLEYESLSGGEIVELLQGKQLNTKKRSQKPSRATQALPPQKNIPAVASANEMHDKSAAVSTAAASRGSSSSMGSSDATALSSDKQSQATSAVIGETKQVAPNSKNAANTTVSNSNVPAASSSPSQRGPPKL